MPWREQRTFVSWVNNSFVIQSCPTPPGRFARRSDPTRTWYVRVLGLTGRISLVPASRKALKRNYIFLQGTVNLCFLGELFCWQPILPDPARPLRRAPRPNPLVVCPGFGFDRSIQKQTYPSQLLKYFH